jgi:hypothetical protein
VDSVTVVEISPEVVQMVKPYLPDNVEVVVADFREWVQREHDQGWDYAILDIWAEVCTDNLADMLSLWDKTRRLGVKHGAIWQLDLTAMTLCDDIRGHHFPSETGDELETLGYTALGAWITDNYDDDYYYDNAPEETWDWDGWGDENIAIAEAFDRVYGLEVLL